MKKNIIFIHPVNSNFQSIPDDDHLFWYKTYSTPEDKQLTAVMY